MWSLWKSRGSEVGQVGRLGLAASVVLSIAVLAVPSFHANAGTAPVDAIGRLIIDGSGVCTAFVVRSIERQVTNQSGVVTAVYENWLVSAGHCAGSDLVFLLQGVAHRLQAILGYSSGHRGHDVMVAVFATDRPVPTLEPAFGERPEAGDKLMLIGYGRNALMMRVGPLLGYDERGHMIVENFASPGNSGGPVLIPGTRRVVGIGIETTLDLRPGMPVALCRLGGCAVKPPYIAAHVDRLQGVVSFR